MSVTVTLSKAITAHGEERREIELREPSGEDLMEIGYPYIVVQSDTGGQGVELRPKVVARYVSKLAQIPMSSVKQIGLADLQKLQGIVMGFFGQEEAATTISTESDS
ncbi:phage tail assembly protein [Cupriavidus respiraculi]|uniref:Phage tail assembly protein n=1 Tax=Cupriavidus respiraculi TaxID=195930 RepID=A0ABM8WXW3_9BURK|nr:phage tail assembly protein [Cupriavidus respiraculi]CAG9172389.1 hypothetical protein LMG21510_01958 [Cupriavidus respiraculi]